ncbi:heme oxygenase [Monoraphidium neglectum]|uniref:heme oxygenase (biliverdin-producing) n=1 Tax=Monoraphidium neglectum TaxID=145388 RepID=A0A0D2MSL3_9CHLO|nr:heme oxygenase [Monoraphidium neglectum]KIZ03427.1 heme oxygenase [Monoraphidium neglectum]|eukprot:XP_013902446.1 heme oxygenase [Monoraphidium neglectum]
MLASKRSMMRSLQGTAQARPAAARAAPRRTALRVRAHGAVSATELKKQGFIGEMRAVAMKLHTRDQAPKEGGQKASPRPMPTWQPTREGYVRFLAESRAVYSAFEDIISKAERPEYEQFQGTGLERVAAIDKDLAWFQETYGISAPQLPADSPGLAYAQKLYGLAVSDPPAFICHYYNYFFAHTAGGRMIGSKVSSMILDNAELEFYKYDGDVAPLLDAVRSKINALSESWTREQKDHCLQETADTFKYSGSLMPFIMGSGGH